MLRAEAALAVAGGVWREVRLARLATGSKRTAHPAVCTLGWATSKGRSRICRYIWGRKRRAQRLRNAARLVAYLWPPVPVCALWALARRGAHRA